MGKNTDKLFITHSEWSQGSHASSSGRKLESLKPSRTIAALPFWTCSISQQPIDKDCGVCDNQGHVFDIKNIMPYILRKKINPVTNEPLSNANELTKLKLVTNDSESYIDPVTFRVFQPLSEVAVIKSSGNVYLMSTIKEMNLKSGHLVDLVSEKPFVKSDILRLHGGVGVLKKSQQAITKEKNDALEKQTIINKKRAITDVDESEETSSIQNKKGLRTTHHLASSVTSTSVAVNTASKLESLPLDMVLVPKKFNEPGFAKIETNLGEMTIELFAKYSPKAVYNFVTHANNGYYNGTTFHRNIRNFMIQGGDPTGTGLGGKSAFPDGKPFTDETNSPYKHDSRGILSMANKGKNTNTSQFFITYRRAPHLDGKHTIFGKIVSNLNVLDNIERSPVDGQDRPIKKIVILDVRILQDPFEEQEKKDREAEEEKERKDNQKQQLDDETDDSPWLRRGNADGSLLVGKYLDLNKRTAVPSASTTQPKTTTASNTISNMLPPATPDEDIKWKQHRKQRTTIQKSSFSGW